MSLVPDLDSSEFDPSFVAYYDFIDNTDLGSIDDIKNLNNKINGNIVKSYTDSEGIVINYKSAPTRDNVTIRASKDGIITVHITKPSETDNSNDDLLDIVNWRDSGTSYDLNNNILKNILKNCLRGLNNWSSDIKPKYKPEDVKIDNLQYESKDLQFTVFSLDDGYNGRYPSAKDYEFSYTDDTQIIDMSFGHSINVTKYSSITTELYVNSKKIFSENAGNSSSSNGGGATTKYNLFNDYSSGDVCKVKLPYNNYVTGGSVSVHIVVAFK